MNLKERLDEQINEAFGKYLTEQGIENGDISPAQLSTYNTLLEGMTKVLEEVAEQNQPRPRQIDVPICFVHLIQDCLMAIKRHNLYSLVYDFDGKDELDTIQMDIDFVLRNFCKPLDELDMDTEIIIEE
jgi:hypothetical protein